MEAYNRIFVCKLSYGTPHFKHLVCPAVVLSPLVKSNLLSAFVLFGNELALHERACAFGVLCVFAESISVHISGEVVFVSIGILGHRYESYLFGSAETGKVCFPQSPCSDWVEQCFALRNTLRLFSPVKFCFRERQIVLFEVVHKVFSTFHFRACNIVYNKTVFNSDRSNTCCENELRFKIPAVVCELVVFAVAVLNAHIAERIPCPVAFSEKLSRIVKAVFVDGFLIVDHKALGFARGSANIVFSAQHMHIGKLFAALVPEFSVIEVDIFVPRQEHTLYDL